MRAAIPTDLLLRLMNATPEQYAAVEKILAPVVLETPTPVGEDVARAAFALLVKLDAQGKQKAPSSLTVFRLYCIEGKSADEVANECHCSKGTVMSRIRHIEDVTYQRAARFRAMSDHLQKIADEYESSGARGIYRRGLTGSEDEVNDE